MIVEREGGQIYDCGKGRRKGGRDDGREREVVRERKVGFEVKGMGVMEGGRERDGGTVRKGSKDVVVVRFWYRFSFKIKCAILLISQKIVYIHTKKCAILLIQILLFLAILLNSAPFFSSTALKLTLYI